MEENSEKVVEPSWGASDDGATTAPWQLCKVYTRSYDSRLSAWGVVGHAARCQESRLGA